MKVTEWNGNMLTVFVNFGGDKFNLKEQFFTMRQTGVVRGKKYLGGNSSGPIYVFIKKA